MMPKPMMPNRILRGPGVWTGADLSRSADWIHTLSTQELAELEAAVLSLRTSGPGHESEEIPLERVGREAFPLPTLGPKLAVVREELLRGRGFVLLRGLPVSRCSRADIAAMFWGIGLQLGVPLQQNAQGHVLGHVVDLGRDAADPHTRIYQTNRRQGYHTDSADIVALVCLQKAPVGGLSSLVSCATVHNAMRERCPESLEELFGVFYTDQRGEHRPGTDPYFAVPILNWFEGELSVLYQRKYIESAQRFDAVPRLTDRQVAALDAFDELLDDQALHLEMDLQPGDIQLVHNHQMLHDRTGYEDSEDPALRRHLLRLWLCPPVGRALPPCFAGRYGSVEPGRRGGILLPGVAPVAPLTC